jgi:hypothetical protein
VQWQSVPGGGEKVNFVKGLLLSLSPTVLLFKKPQSNYAQVKRNKNGFFFYSYVSSHQTKLAGHR